IETCLQGAIDAQITIELLTRTILDKFNLEDELMNPKNIKKFSEDFIRNLVDTCMYGGSEVTLEELLDRRAKLVIKLADPTCIHQSDRPQYIKCAMNPKGDCNNCQFKETKNDD
ncbi:MAG: DUF6464 family protein, partial [Xenococcaceae cyanobacterium]